MLLDIALIAGTMAKAFLESLNGDGSKLKALVEDEAHKLAMSLATIGQLLAARDIEADEAEALVEVQKSATETVFASLEGIGRVAARRATHAGLSSVLTAVDTAIGFPLIATLTGSGGGSVSVS